MARPKTGKSPQTKYRRARERIADLEAQISKVGRSRPRTPGKKGWKTRRLAALQRQLSATRGQLTKARNEIARDTATRRAAKVSSTRSRSDAAKKGWETRRSRARPAVVEARRAGPGGQFMPFLTLGGLVYINPVGHDRSLVGSYWNAVDRLLADGSTASLDRFEGRRVWDSATGKHLAFVTDPNVILAYHEDLDFGPSFYKSRGEVERMERFAA